MMKVNIGSKNPNKYNAVRESFIMFGAFKQADFQSIEAASLVSDQPVGFDETVRGARNRAENAFMDCNLSVGLESGLVVVPHTRTGYMNLTVCAIYDGSEFFIGTGPAFELPEGITQLVVNDGLELDDAILKSGFTENPRIGYSEGIIGIMTKGVVTRKDYMVPSVSMAVAGFISK